MKELKNVNGMPTLNFNLRQPKGNKKTNVYAVINIDGRQIKTPIGEKINPWQWDKKKQCPKFTENMTDNDRDNAMEVFNIIYLLKDVFQNYYVYLCSSKREPNVYEIINLLKRNIRHKETEIMEKKESRPKKVVTATSLLDECIKVYPSMYGVKESSLKTYNIKIVAFKKYCKEIGKDKISMLTDDGLKTYEYYLREKGESSNKIKDIINTLKLLINKVLCENPKFKRYGINKITMAVPKAKKSSGKKFPLTDEEVDRLRKCDGLSEKQIEYRDLFLLACLTGQRASDLHKLFSDKYEDRDGIRQYYNEKRTVETNVVMTDEICQLIEKYKKNGFKHVELKKDIHYFLTYYIKEVAEKANLNRIITYTEEGEEKQKPLYKLISSHIGRHTFITNQLKKGVDKDLIAMQSGHKNTDTIENVYSHLTQEDKRIKLLNAVKGTNSNTTTVNYDSEFAYNKGKEDKEKELIKETKDVLIFLGAKYEDIEDINDLDKLMPLLYTEYEPKLTELGISTKALKNLFNYEGMNLKEKKEELEKIKLEIFTT